MDGKEGALLYLGFVLFGILFAWIGLSIIGMLIGFSSNGWVVVSPCNGLLRNKKGNWYHIDRYWKHRAILILNEMKLKGEIDQDCYLLKT